MDQSIGNRGLSFDRDHKARFYLWSQVLRTGMGFCAVESYKISLWRAMRARELGARRGSHWAPSGSGSETQEKHHPS